MGWARAGQGSQEVTQPCPHLGPSPQSRMWQGQWPAAGREQQHGSICPSVLREQSCHCAVTELSHLMEGISPRRSWPGWQKPWPGLQEGLWEGSGAPHPWTGPFPNRRKASAAGEFITQSSGASSQGEHLNLFHFSTEGQCKTRRDQSLKVVPGVTRAEPNTPPAHRRKLLGQSHPSGWSC